MKKDSGFFLSSDEKTNIHYTIWAPEPEKPKAVLQIIHGMSEHVNRYDDFAVFLTTKGFAVIGHDILGHGLTAVTKDDFGFFANNNGNKHNINDINTMHEIALEKYPESSHFMLGHSMGSFLLRQYLHSFNHSRLNGAIIMGTGHEPWPLLRLGILISNALCKTAGKKHKSRLLYQMTLGNKNHAFSSEGSKNAWLTNDTEIQNAYKEDPLCGFPFTAGAYRDMFKGIYSLYLPKNLAKMNKYIPILITSGTMDPIGGYGANVEKVYSAFKAISLNDVTLKLWRGMRHEILNDKNRAGVYEYIYEWIDEHIKKG